MNKKDNGWYLVEVGLTTFGRLLRPRLSGLVVGIPVAVGVILLMTLIGTDSLARHPALFQLLFFALFCVFFAFVLLRARRRARGARDAYIEALQSAQPEPLMVAIDELLRPIQKVVPDAEAYVAEGKAVGFALYGNEAEATRTLGAISWREKAPLVQGVGLQAEGIVAYLCRRDVARGLELTRRAHGLAAVNENVPGAAQQEKSFAAFVAVGESLAGRLAPEGRARLEACAVDPKFVPRQLLSAFALAIDAERAGDAARAERWRTFLRATAPYCAPLHLRAEDFETPRGVPEEEGPVSASLTSAPSLGATALRSPRRKALTASARLLVFWIAAIGMFLAIWTFLSK
jgi:hypothetical protein